MFIAANVKRGNLSPDIFPIHSELLVFGIEKFKSPDEWALFFLLVRQNLTRSLHMQGRTSVGWHAVDFHPEDHFSFLV